MNSENKFIFNILDIGDVPDDGVLVVHASFSKLSQLGMTADRICEAFINRMANGTVLMPAMSWRAVTKDQPVFDENKTPSITGVLSETFRSNWATYRSLHPHHSVCGYGRLAKILLATHHEGTTPCGGNSPYGIMRDYPCYILLIDVGLECCTAIHYIEEMMAPDLYLCSEEQAETYTLIDHKGDVHEVRTRRHNKSERDFSKFEQALIDCGGMVKGQDHGVDWRLINLNSLYRLVFSVLSENRAGTLKSV